MLIAWFFSWFFKGVDKKKKKESGLHLLWRFVILAPHVWEPHLMFWALPSPKGPLVAQSETEQPGLDSKPLALASLSRIKWTSRRALKGKRCYKTCRLRGKRWMVSNEGFFIFVAPGSSRRPGTDGKALKTCLLIEWLTEREPSSWCGGRYGGIVELLCGDREWREVGLGLERPARTYTDHVFLCLKISPRQSSQSLQVSKVDSSELTVGFILLNSSRRDLTVA